jgi:hypothetical protein
MNEPMSEEAWMEADTVVTEAWGTLFELNMALPLDRQRALADNAARLLGEADRLHDEVERLTEQRDRARRIADWLLHQEPARTADRIAWGPHPPVYCETHQDWWERCRALQRDGCRGV